MSGIPFWLRTGVVLVLMGSCLLLLTLALIWRQVPWLDNDISALAAINPAGVMQDKSHARKAVFPVLDAHALHQRLLLHFAHKAQELSSDYEADWLTMDLTLRPINLSLLRELPIWPGWQLQGLSMQPEGQIWRLGLRWELPQETGALALLPASDGAFEVDIWQRQIPPVPISAVATAGDLPVTRPAWRYLGYVADQQGLGAWLGEAIDSEQGPNIWFVRQGEVWQGWKLVHIAPAGLHLQQGGQHWVLTN
jgi:hypothetical protein